MEDQKEPKDEENPQCSQPLEPCAQIPRQENKNPTSTIEITLPCKSKPVPSARNSLASVSVLNINNDLSSAPLILIHRPSLLVAKSSVISQPVRIFSNLPSPSSHISPKSNQPTTLLQQALTKLQNQNVDTDQIHKPPPSCNISPPDSLGNAPPTYSFVLRQKARRWPRLLGTFIPSPSFVLHPPPPNYAAAYDVYIDNIQQPTRLHHFGFVPMHVVCHSCGFAGLTLIRTRVTVCTHLCAIFLCIFCCWICTPLPYILKSCKDVYHYCPNCRMYLGMYCPSNPAHLQ